VKRRRIRLISSGAVGAGAVSTLAWVAVTWCLACSPVTLNSSPEDGGDTRPDAGELCEASDDRCEGDTYRRCNSVGVFEDTVCELGCSTDGGAHCRQLHPALLGTPISMSCDTAEDFAPSSDVFFDTSTGAILDRADQSEIRAPGTGQDASTGIGFQVMNQGAVTEVGIFTFAKLTLPLGTHQVRGTRAAAFIACDRLEVHGLLNVRADGDMPGPGGHAPATGGPGAGGEGQQDPNGNHPGGGGGGYGGTGGGGGAGVLPGGTRGLVYGNVSALPLVGGSSGGGSGGGNAGGAGGGAIYLASATAIRFTGGGTINAGGGGGSTGPSLSGGGGGGAGGTIFLDAPVIELVGGATLAVNGGGGAITDQQSLAGENGLAGQGPAGPVRGASDQSAQGDEGSNGAGGGGGCGRMRFLSASGAVDLSDTAISPRSEVINLLGERIVSQDIADIK
jgi:hypothetical protein